MALSKEQIARVKTEVPRWVELLKKQRVPDFLIPYCIAQIITETGWFSNRSYNTDRNPGGVTWNKNYINNPNRPGTSRGTARSRPEWDKDANGNRTIPNYYVHFDTWDNAARDYTRVLKLNKGLGAPLDAKDINDYVARLIKNGYMANSTNYLNTMKGVQKLLVPHIDVAALIKKKTRYSSGNLWADISNFIFGK